MQVRVAEEPRARALADELDRRWRGRRTDDQTNATILGVHLISSPHAWPPTVVIDFTMSGRRGTWSVATPSLFLDRGPVSDAADWFAQIAWEAFPEMQATGYVPDGLRFAS
jgi:hypothetical protein